MMDMGYMDSFFAPLDLPPIVKPNLRTGEGHGHYRPLSRKKPEKGCHKKKHVKTKMTKKSKRRNRA